MPAANTKLDGQTTTSTRTPPRLDSKCDVIIRISLRKQPPSAGARRPAVPPQSGAIRIFLSAEASLSCRGGGLGLGALAAGDGRGNADLLAFRRQTVRSSACRGACLLLSLAPAATYLVSRVGLGWVGLGWVGLGWVGLGCVGLGWIGLGSGWNRMACGMGRGGVGGGRNNDMNMLVSG